VRAVVVLGAVVAAAVQLPDMLATAAIGASQAAERSGRPAAALSWARTAISVEGWNADAYQQRALVLEAGGRLAAARADLRHAVSLEPFDFRHWLLLARVDTEQGDLAAAVCADERARQLRPLGIPFAGTPAPVSTRC
jgi:tetratricopeptide (TPR) repeat protein